MPTPTAIAAPHGPDCAADDHHGAICPFLNRSPYVAFLNNRSDIAVYLSTRLAFA